MKLLIIYILRSKFEELNLSCPLGEDLDSHLNNPIVNKDENGYVCCSAMDGGAASSVPQTSKGGNSSFIQKHKDELLNIVSGIGDGIIGAKASGELSKMFTPLKQPVQKGIYTVYKYTVKGKAYKFTKNVGIIGAGITIAQVGWDLSKGVYFSAGVDIVSTGLSIGASMVTSAIAAGIIAGVGIAAAPAALITGVGVAFGIFASIGISMAADEIKDNHYRR